MGISGDWGRTNYLKGDYTTKVILVGVYLNDHMTPPIVIKNVSNAALRRTQRLEGFNRFIKMLTGQQYFKGIIKKPFLKNHR